MLSPNDGKKSGSSRFICPDSCTKLILKMAKNVFEGAHLRPIIGRDVIFSDVYRNKDMRSHKGFVPHLELVHEAQKVSFEAHRLQIANWRFLKIQDENTPSFAEMVWALVERDAVAGA